MKRLVERAGFEVLELCTPGQLDVDIVKNSLEENPRTCHGSFASSFMK